MSASELRHSLTTVGKALPSAKALAGPAAVAEGGISVFRVGQAYVLWSSDRNRAVGYLGEATLRLFGMALNVKSLGSAPDSGLGNQNPFFKSALQPYNNELTNAGRALTKHPELVGETKKTLRQVLRSDAALNSEAADSLKYIIRNGVTTTPNLPRYGKVTQIQIRGGFGARWGADGSFIGFVNP